MGLRVLLDMKQNILCIATCCVAMNLQVAHTSALNTNPLDTNIIADTMGKAVSKDSLTTTVNNFGTMTINSDWSQRRVINNDKLLITGSGKIGGLAGSGTALINGGTNDSTGKLYEGTVKIDEQTVVPIDTSGHAIENISSIENVCGTVEQYGGSVGQVYNHSKYIYGGGIIRAFSQEEPDASVSIINGQIITLKDGYQIGNGVVNIGKQDLNGKPLSDGVLCVKGNVAEYNLWVGEGHARLNLLNNYTDEKSGYWAGGLLVIDSGTVVIDGEYAKWEGDIHLKNGTLILENVISNENAENVNSKDCNKFGLLFATGGTVICKSNVIFSTRDFIGKNVKVIKGEEYNIEKEVLPY